MYKFFNKAVEKYLFETEVCVVTGRRYYLLPDANTFFWLVMTLSVLAAVLSALVVYLLIEPEAAAVVTGIFTWFFSYNFLNLFILSKSRMYWERYLLRKEDLESTDEYRESMTDIIGFGSKFKKHSSDSVEVKTSLGSLEKFQRGELRVREVGRNSLRIDLALTKKGIQIRLPLTVSPEKFLDLISTPERTYSSFLDL